MNLVSMLKNSNNTNSFNSMDTSNTSNVSTHSNTSSNSNASQSWDFINNSNTSQSNQLFQPDSNFEIPDIEMLMKFSQIIKKMNSTENTATTNLLFALKPFLKENKREKLEQYVKMYKMFSVISELNNNGNVEIPFLKKGGEDMAIMLILVLLLLP